MLLILLINIVIMQLLFLVSYFKCFVVCLFNPCSNDASFFFLNNGILKRETMYKNDFKCYYIMCVYLLTRSGILL